MSPSWRNQFQIYFAPKRIDWVFYSRGFKPALLAKGTIACPQITDSDSDWASSMQQLEQLLRDQEVAGSELSITLSNHFIRFVILPAQSEINTPEEVSAYADFRMREIYQDRVDHWTLAISQWDPFNGAICAAIPSTLLGQFETLAVQYKIKLQTVEPYLASVYEHWQPTLDQDQLFLAIIESDRLCLASLHQGIWQNIRNQRITQDIYKALHIALDQEMILSGEKEFARQVYLFAPEHPVLNLPEDSDWQFIPLATAEHPALEFYPSATTQLDEAQSCTA